MLELPAVEDIIRALDQESEEKHISSITEVNMIIGELSSYVGECVQLYFDILSAGHTCEGAKLNITHTRAKLKCSCCGLLFDHGRDFSCPSCKGEGKLVKGTGEEFVIASIRY